MRRRSIAHTGGAAPSTSTATEPSLRGAQHLPDEGCRVHPLQLGVLDATLHAGDLEQVEDELAELLELLVEHVERGLGGLGGLDGVARPAAARDVQRRGHGRDRRPQLVADVRREACLALDAGPEREHHRVERLDERLEVGIALRVEPFVQVTVCDAACSHGHPPDRAQDAAAGVPTDDGPEDRRDERRRGEGAGEEAERLIQVLRRRELEERAVDRRERNSDTDVRRRAELGVLGPHRAARDELAQRLRHVVSTDSDRGAEPLVTDAEHHRAVASHLRLAQRTAHVERVHPQRIPHRRAR